MGTEDNTLSLEGLAQRLEALERENAELRHEVTELRGSGTRLEGAVASRDSDMRHSGDGESAVTFEGLVSRKSLLSKAGAAAVAAMAAGTLLYPRQAKAFVGTAEITPDNIATHFLVADNHVDNRGAIFGIANTTSKTVGAVNGSNFGDGPGVRGEYRGLSADSADGVLGINAGGTGVKGEGLTGVWGLSSSAGFAATYGQNTNAGWGVVGDGKGAAYSGVMGRSDSGSGIKGASTSGYGGRFEGGKAQLMLKPKGTVGKPTTDSHAKGEIYMDSAATLWVCTVAGTPGTWRKVATTAN